MFSVISFVMATLISKAVQEKTTFAEIVYGILRIMDRDIDFYRMDRTDEMGNLVFPNPLFYVKFFPLPSILKWKQGCCYVKIDKYGVFLSNGHLLEYDNKTRAVSIRKDEDDLPYWHVNLSGVKIEDGLSDTWSDSAYEYDHTLSDIYRFMSMESLYESNVSINYVRNGVVKIPFDEDLCCRKDHKFILKKKQVIGSSKNVFSVHQININ
jgi:hypothetical protein